MSLDGTTLGGRTPERGGRSDAGGDGTIIPFTRPVIRVETGQRPAAVRAAESALIAVGGVYRQGERLVRIARIDADTDSGGVRRAAGSLIITAVTQHWLSHALARIADWETLDKRGELRVIDPPVPVARELLALSGEWRLPVLRGIVTAPTLRTDGSLLDCEGYDARSGLYMDFGGLEYPAINPTPSVQEAREALRALADLLSECAFVGGAQSPSASAMLATIITATVRRALDIAPVLAVTAKQASSGKTALAHIIARILTGREAAVIPLDQEAAELGRRLLGVLLAGDPVLCLDNAVSPVDSAALCAALTSESYQDRIIRSSTMARVSTAVTMIITGNGLRLVGDLTTRALGCALDTGLDRPQERTYQRDIAAFIAEHRARLVQAALTIPLAYLSAGAPALPVRPSRFHQWDRLVRLPLIWLACADPMETQVALEDADPEREKLRVLLATWMATCGERGVTVAALMRAAAQQEALREALLGIGSDGTGRLNALRIGNYLAERVGQVVDGLQISDAGRDSHSKTRCYRIAARAAPASG